MACLHTAGTVNNPGRPAGEVGGRGHGQNVKFVCSAVLRGLRAPLRAMSNLGLSRDVVRGASARQLARVINVGRLQRLLLAFTGASLIAFGAVSTMQAGLGVGPTDVLITGLSETASLSITVAAWSVIGSSALLLVIVGGRPTLGGLFVSIVVGGMFSVAFLAVPDVSAEPWTEKTFMFALGLGLICLGVEAAAASGLGRGNAELLAERLALLLRVDVRLTRTLWEATLLTGGILLGGDIGVGTIVIMAGIGPALAVMNSVVVDSVVGRRVRVGQPERLIAAAIPRVAPPASRESTR